MKQVICDTPKIPIVALSAIKFSNVYGLTYTLTDGTKEKAFITREAYNSGYYISRCVSAIQYGNSCHKSLDLTTLIGYHLNRGDNVFEFDDEQELMRWLAL